MPKQTVSRDEILNTALKIVRKQGIGSVNARSVAKFLGCSVQPIYSYFNSMDALKNAVYGKAMKFYNDFIYSNTDSNFILQSMSKANVAFAKYETNLFKMLFFKESDTLKSFNDIYEWMGDKETTQKLAEKLNMNFESVKNVYIKLIVFTHGVATMIATGGAQISDKEISDFLEEAYNTFIKVNI